MIVVVTLFRNEIAIKIDSVNFKSFSSVYYKESDRKKIIYEVLLTIGTNLNAMMK
jgi:hypothetical protein